MLVTYTIRGVPVSVIKSSHIARKVLDPYNLRKMNYQQQLSHQHNDKPLLTGAWALQAHFLFEPPRNKQSKLFVQMPITPLLRFVDEIAHGVIYDSECVIHKLDVDKKYTDTNEAQTILIFRRIE